MYNSTEFPDFKYPVHIETALRKPYDYMINPLFHYSTQDYFTLKFRFILINIYYTAMIKKLIQRIIMNSYTITKSQLI